MNWAEGGKNAMAFYFGGSSAPISESALAFKK